MKINTLLTIITLWFFTSCQDDNNITPNSLVTEALQNKYPTAEQIKWDTEKAYITASFQKDQLIHTAWFDHFGQWYMTEIELNQKEKLPEAVRSAFELSEYKDGRIDDIDLLARLDAENIYVIEVDKDGHEYHLCYSEDGILVKTILDNEKKLVQGFSEAEKEQFSQLLSRAIANMGGSPCQRKHKVETENNV
jgi:hypothetical protein